MLKVGFVGWRGMVGSVLMQRMVEDGDFNGIEPVFFTTSQVGQPGPDVGVDVPPLKDAFDLEALKVLDVIVTCQGGDYTKKVFDDLRGGGWKGYWIDAASTLRMADEAPSCWTRSTARSSTSNWPVGPGPSSAATAPSA